MAKVNVNSATRQDLVDVAGLRPDLADEILRFRRRGKLTSVEALGEVPGVGPATLEQLREALDFRDQAGNGDDRGPEREVVQRSTEGAAELGQALVGLVHEQTQHSLETFTALTSVVDWDRAFRIQGEFLRASLERTAQLNQRYLEVAQEVTTAAASAAKQQGRKAE